MSLSPTQSVSPAGVPAFGMPEPARAIGRQHASRAGALSALDSRLIEQYFNTYCRETGRFDPRVTHDTSLPQALREVVRSWREAGYDAASVTFPHDGSCLCVALEYDSPIGFHGLGPHAAIATAEGVVVLLDGPDALIVKIVDALAFRFPAIGRARPLDFMAAMRNSVARVRRYQASRRPPAGPLFMQAEQSLCFGHAFHVTSKASEGFDDDDLQAYAPELGASFRLHYFAVSDTLMNVRSIDGESLAIDPEAMAAAAALLGDSEYRLLPCHPWQADYLLQQPAITALCQSRDLISLGPLGEVVWPTSSVRTVWLPMQQRFVKFALDVRITNFVRNNPPEQVARALDASRYIAALPCACWSSAGFEVLLDSGCASLAVADAALQASSAVVYRDAMRDERGATAQVVAALLEAPVAGTAPLHLLLAEALGSSPSFERVAAWWGRYLEVMLLPLLRLYACHGVSLEAHLQNTMVAFDAGWPARGYVRDMEGASISRTRCARADILAPDSPALYDDDQAWMRFRYYVLVNHVGHVIASIARTGVCDEAALWRVSAQAWASDAEPAMSALLADLRRLPTLPAKANMLSCFGGHGETPAWVEIPNPLYQEAANASR